MDGDSISPTSTMSYSEDLFEQSLNLVLKPGIKVIRNFRPDFLKNPKSGHNLEYDFYIPEAKVAFEIQGIHHLRCISMSERRFEA